MTPYAIADHHGYHFAAREQTEWQVFDEAQNHCGQINAVSGWTVPKGIHEQLGLPNRRDLDLFLTSAGQWASTLEHAEHYLLHTEPPIEFLSTGATLGFFVPPQWSEENGTPNTYEDYRVFRHPAGYWDAEEIEPAPVMEDFEQF
jgi:hypothetical protein